MLRTQPVVQKPLVITLMALALPAQLVSFSKTVSSIIRMVCIFAILDYTSADQFLSDCVAITSGDSITVTNMYCSGGHGLSIGSIGGKASSTNSVSNVLIENSRVLNSSNGVRIKTNYNTTGYVGNVTYSDIILDGNTDYGLDIQQDYLNGGPTGSPSNGVSAFLH